MDYTNYNDYELLYMVKESEDALEFIVKKYDPIIKHVALKFKNLYGNYSLDLDDLMQEGRIAVVEACNSFCVKRNVVFYTYVLVIVNRRISNYIRDTYQSLSNKSLSYADSIDDILVADYEHPLEIVQHDEMISILKEFSYSLDLDERCVFSLKFNDFSYKEISDLLDISVKTVDNKVFKINKKLKKYLLSLKY